MRTLADLRYAFRTLAKSPGFAAIAILSLALGIGANTAMFSFVDAILLRPLPVPDAGRIIAINSTAPGTRLSSMSYPDYADLRDRNRTLSGLICYDMVPMGVSVNRDQVPRLSLGIVASGNLFTGLGMEISVGRSFRPDEDSVPGRDLVAIISHGMWEREYASDQSAIGRRLRINGADFTIIGVGPKGFTGPQAFVPTDVYVPLNSFPQILPNASKEYLASRGNRTFTVFARPKPGVSMPEVQAEASTIASQLAAQYPETNRDRTVTALGYLRARYENDPVDGLLGILLLAIASLVLMIACANIANLLLARGTARAKEIAIRQAIGAGRARLVRQLLTESLLLAILGGIAGLAVGYAGVEFLKSVRLPSDFPIELGARIDTRLLTYSLLVSIATSVLFGLLPALRSTRTDLAKTIKASDSGPAQIGFFRGRFSVRNILVISQLALSVVLLMLSAFFVRGFQTARAVEPGFRLDHTLFLSLDPSLQRYDEAKGRRFYRDLTDRLRTVAGVRNVSLASHLQFDNNQSGRQVIPEGYQLRPNEQAPRADAAYIVDEHYFDLMEVGIVSGRAFDSRDTAASPRVVIVNEVLAKKLFPNRNPIGQRVRLDRDEKTIAQIVGVAKQGKYQYWAETPTGAAWTPFAQEYSAAQFVEVRTAGDPAALTAAVRDQVHTLDPDLAIFRVSTMEDYYTNRAMLGPRLVAQIVTATGVMGLIIAVIGLYGVVAYTVSRRTREIGIRMAIGARPADVQRMVLSQGMAFTAIGLGIGLAVAIPVIAGQMLQGFVTGVSAHDPAIVIGIPAILAAVMIAACWIPAARAARTDPTRALRIE